MDLKSMQAFIHLANSMHFGKSAEALHLSPSTLSRMIQRLEQDVGTKLLQRDNRSVALTAAGQKFLTFSLQQVDNWQQLKLGLTEHKTQLEGKLAIYCSVTAAYSHLPRILDTFRLAHPQIEIALITGDAAQAIEKVQEGEVDVAIAACPDNLSTRLKFYSLAEIPLTIVAPTIHCAVQQQLKGAIIPWSDLPYILPEHGPARRRINSWFRQMHIKTPNIYAKVNGHEALVSMVALGCGVGIVPDVVVENSPVRDRVQIVKSDKLLESFDLGVVCLKKRFQDPLISAFLSGLE
ncbi:HTH-type transcriptional activator IlvY [Motilimonas pumila]|uniref:HTH-type transcriptional activator IlvY n=1 Tax=Motilimonas pumila TaxID=2303987 RepID=A0A418YJ08_9GAMM|nr:HTH-type transcriptional activator IlvY [Motilimonas pumila]RJG50620.1 HTH-type transcriptional activator IlvY [Motilimonas pumila]